MRLFLKNIGNIYCKPGIAPRNAPAYINKSKMEASKPSVALKKYKCRTCGYVYDEEQEGVIFSDLPDNWTCPICGTDKSDFVEV